MRDWRGMAQGKLYIGTSGYAYKGWHDVFYPAGLPRREELFFYAGHFPAVEINASFYRLPTPKSVRRWVEATPDHFRFCLKVSRYITHQKRLLDPREHVPLFMRAVKGAARKRGPLLLQLPPGLKPEHERLDNVLKAFGKSARGWQVAVEIRNSGWYGPALNELLDRHKAALVLHDMPGSRAEQPNSGAPFVYARFHGPRGDYGGSYRTDTLRRWAGLLRPHRRAGKDLWVFFNNDRDTGAIANAGALRNMLK
jgi:uncharacterized protein YecE (DUF72 family)